MSGIRVEGLTKSYRGSRVVQDVSFAAEAGTVTGLLGPNGSGKTTVLRLMTGLARGEGNTLYDGIRFGEHRYPRRHVGVSIGSAPFNLARSGLHHMELVALGSGVDRRRAEAVLDEVGLATVAGRRVKTYSLGMRQRLAIAAAMIGEPKFVVLDEPTNGLDPTSVLWFEQWVRRLADQGRCVVISTHQLHDAERYLDQAVVLLEGRIAASGTLDQLRDLTHPPARVIAESSANTELVDTLRAKGLAADLGPDRVVIHDCEPKIVGEIATHAGIPLRGLRVERASLEEVFARLCTHAPQASRRP